MRLFTTLLFIPFCLFGEQTLAIIKPDAVQADHVGDIISRIEKSGLHINGLKMIQLTPQQAARFYAVHQDKPFYDELTAFMTSGPVVVMAIEGDHAIRKYRNLMGATNPKEAAAHTLRAEFGTSIDKNAVHGSDGSDTARQEVRFFFKAHELH